MLTNIPLTGIMQFNQNLFSEEKERIAASLICPRGYAHRKADSKSLKQYRLRRLQYLTVSHLQQMQIQIMHVLFGSPNGQSTK